MKLKAILSKFRLSTPLCSKYALLAGLLLATQFAVGQDKAGLQKERDRISEEINLTSKLLKETRDNRNKVEAELSLLNRKIGLREDLIKTLRREIALYGKQIDQNKKQISELEASLQALKDDYAKMIRFAQKNSSAEDRLMYIFASKDFYQATSRIKYLQQIARYREDQAKDIVATQADLDRLNLKLLSVINEKDALLKNEEQVRRELSQDVVAQKSAVEGLQQEEKGLLKKLREQEKQREKLNKEIQRIIEAEIRASKKDNAGVFSLTPEAAALSASFENNKGKLPWPVERGVITAKFGQNPHPVLAGIMVPNNGVDIATSNNATVRAVFEGTVSGVFSIPGAGQNVIINHGGYRTVYSNLKEVFVSKGQKVDIKQSIGTVLTDESSGKTEAHLEIWKVSESGTTKQDPALWIYRQ
jgi:septal ring factor EnvC (AmiA/AmiB activator)